jgi:hypothetical protein
MKMHRFALVLSGVSEITPEVAHALYEATGGDIEFEMRDGATFLEFSRTAANLRAAITSAIRNVDEAKIGVRVVRVESEAANTIAIINAELLGLSNSTG